MSETEDWAVLEVTADYSKAISYIAVDYAEEDMKRAVAKKIGGHMRIVASELTREEAIGLRAVLQAANRE
jgi:hypothetical protein